MGKQNFDERSERLNENDSTIMTNSPVPISQNFQFSETRNCTIDRFSPATTFILFTRGCPVSGGVDTPSRPTPSTLTDTPFPYSSPLPTPGHPQTPSRTLRPELQTHFLDNTNVTKFTVFTFTHPSFMYRIVPYLVPYFQDI